jgi:hypothetical protein
LVNKASSYRESRTKLVNEYVVFAPHVVRDDEPGQITLAIQDQPLATYLVGPVPPRDNATGGGKGLA